MDRLVRFVPKSEMDRGRNPIPSQGVCYFYYVDGTEVFTVDSITYTPAPVPLPAAAWTGMSLLGAMGVTAGLRARLRRR